MNKTSSNRLKQTSTLLKASIIYTLANIFIKGLYIITTPFFTRILSTSEMGVVTTFTSWQTIINVIATLSLSTGAFNVAMLEFKDNRDQYESSILTLSTISAIIVLIIYLIFSDTLDNIFNISRVLMLIMLLSFIVLPATDYWLARQRYEYQYKKTAVVTFISSFLTAVASIIAVIVAKNEGYSNLGTVRIIAMISIPLVFAFFFYCRIIRNGKTFFNTEYWKFALKINSPLMFHALAKHVLDVSDRVMISNMLGKSAVGIYGTLYSISSLSLIIWVSINASLVPYMFEKLKLGKEGGKEIVSIINPLLLFYAILAFMITLVAPEIVRILATKEYYDAIYVMPPVAAGIFLTSLYNVFGNVLLYYKKTIYIMLATIGAALINVGLNYLLIPKYGFIAAAYTTLFAYILLTVFQYVAMKLVHRRKLLDGKQTLLMATATIILIMGCNILYQHTIVRYCLVITIIISVVIFRKKIHIILLKIRNNK